MIQELLARGLDEISFMYMSMQNTPPKTAAAVGSLREYMEMEGADDPAKFFANPGYTPGIEISDPFRRRRYNVMKFRFDSCVYTQHAENRVVRGRYYERHGEPDAPLAILLHGWRMDSYMVFDRYARLFVREGLNCAMPDLPYHMRRTPRGSFAGEHTFRDDAIHTMETLRQALFDVMSIMNWAREKKGTSRFCVMGVSFGGLLAGLLACYEPRMNAAVLVAPPVDLAQMFKSSRLGRVFERENPRAERMLRVYSDLLDRLGLQNMTPLTPKENIFIAEALYDGMVPPLLVEELWHAWGHPTIQRYPHGHLSIIMFNTQLDHDLSQWLRSLDALKS